jgi:hypothetical protein
MYTELFGVFPLFKLGREIEMEGDRDGKGDGEDESDGDGKGDVYGAEGIVGPLLLEDNK